MTKKSANRKLAEVQTKRPRSLALEGIPTIDEVRSTFTNAFMAEATQAFSSEEQAVSLLLSNITDKLGTEGSDKSQMHDFLRLVLETDPALKDEILEGITIRK